MCPKDIDPTILSIHFGYNNNGDLINQKVKLKKMCRKIEHLYIQYEDIQAHSKKLNPQEREDLLEEIRQ